MPFDMGLVCKAVQKAIGRVWICVPWWLPTEGLDAVVDFLLLVRKKGQEIDVVRKIGVCSLPEMAGFKEVSPHFGPNSLFKGLKKQILRFSDKRRMIFHDSGLDRGLPRRPTIGDKRYLLFKGCLEGYELYHPHTGITNRASALQCLWRVKLVLQRIAKYSPYELKVRLKGHLVNAQGLCDYADILQGIGRDKTVIKSQGQDLEAIMILEQIKGECAVLATAVSRKHIVSTW